MEIDDPIHSYLVARDPHSIVWPSAFPCPTIDTSLTDKVFSIGVCYDRGET